MRDAYEAWERYTVALSRPTGFIYELWRVANGHLAKEGIIGEISLRMRARNYQTPQQRLTQARVGNCFVFLIPPKWAEKKLFITVHTTLLSRPPFSIITRKL